MTNGVDHLYEFLGYLSTKGCGTIGKSLYANAEPDETTGPTLFVIEEPSARAPGYTYSTATVRTPRFRIEARSTGPTAGDYPDITNARNLVQKAWTACRDLVNLRVSSTLSGSTGAWLSALPEQEPYLAGRDSANRVIFAFSVQAERMA